VIDGVQLVSCEAEHGNRVAADEGRHPTIGGEGVEGADVDPARRSRHRAGTR
jgi:hypothetical protein